MSKVCLRLPWPPSVNDYYHRGKTGIRRTKRGNQFRYDVLMLLTENPPRHLGKSRLSVHMMAWPPDKRKRDMDNLLKPILDALEATEFVFENDSQIEDVRITKGPPTKPELSCVEIVLREVSDDWMKNLWERFRVLFK
jgi:crossover junction endodeoxyribonuclease RusA